MERSIGCGLAAASRRTVWLGPRDWASPSTRPPSGGDIRRHKDRCCPGSALAPAPDRLHNLEEPALARHRRVRCVHLQRVGRLVAPRTGAANADAMPGPSGTRDGTVAGRMKLPDQRAAVLTRRHQRRGGGVRHGRRIPSADRRSSHGCRPEPGPSVWAWTSFLLVSRRREAGQADLADFTAKPGVQHSQHCTGEHHNNQRRAQKCAREQVLCLLCLPNPVSCVVGGRGHTMAECNCSLSVPDMK